MEVQEPECERELESNLSFSQAIFIVAGAEAGWARALI
jgi:hypothetical protein